MRLVSYARNFEDVMLWRALKNVREGCYVDVGAQHPIVDSVSRFFYEQGWRGVHIEPVPEYAELLRQDRPDETVMEIALGVSNAQLTLNVFPEAEWSASVAAHADSHAGEQRLQARAMQVPCTTLASALSFMAGREIHWLKIDVEGMEGDVLQGWNSQALRPWIILVKSTLSTSHNPSHTTWEPLLEQANYRFVYFDGLNRFYVATEHAHLSVAFMAPPNVFDGFELSGQTSADWCKGVQARSSELESLAARSKEELQLESKQVELLEAGLAQMRLELARTRSSHVKEIKKLQAALKRSQQESEQISAQLQAVYESRIWRMTGLIRKPIHAGKSIVNSGSALARNPRQATRQAVKASVVWVLRGVLARPHIQHRAMELLSRYPSVKQRLRLLAIRTGLIGNSQSSAAIDNPLAVTIEDGEICMPARTAAIFEDLKRAVEEGNQ